MTDVTVVDYGGGNVRSLRAALARAGARTAMADEPGLVRAATHLVLAGQGAADTASAALRARRLDDAIRAAVAEGARLLGVCVGHQLLFRASSEGDAPGLGLLDGDVVRLAGVRLLPHMGWNDVEPVTPHPLVAAAGVAYFAHSYACRASADVVATTPVDDVAFVSIAGRGRVVGCQFHPERSGPYGAAILERFLRDAA